MRKAQADMAKAENNKAKLKAEMLTEMKRIQSEEKIEGAKLGQRIGDALLEAAIKGEGDSAKEFAEGVRLAIEIQREINNQSK